MAQVKATFYPTVEGQIKDYYDNAADKFAGAIGVKYGTTPATILLLNDHKANMPIKSAKAFADDATAQQSFDEKDAEFALGKEHMLAEMQRVQRLPIWEETDAEGLGIRKVKTPVDLLTVKGKITGTTSTPEMVIIDFLKGSLQGVIIETLADNSPAPIPGPGPQPDPGPVWKKLDIDTKSPYEDKRMNKQVNEPEARYYRVRPLFDDKPVGIHSDIVKVVAEIYPAS